jgi:hypothetical protein
MSSILVGITLFFNYSYTDTQISDSNSHSHSQQQLQLHQRFKWLEHPALASKQREGYEFDPRRDHFVFFNYTYTHTQISDSQQHLHLHLRFNWLEHPALAGTQLKGYEFDPRRDHLVFNKLRGFLKISYRYVHTGARHFIFFMHRPVFPLVLMYLSN